MIIGIILMVLALYCLAPWRAHHVQALKRHTCIIQRTRIVCKNKPSSQSNFRNVMAPWAFKTVKFLGIAALVWLSIFTALPGSTTDARSTAATISEQSARELKGMSTIDVRNHWPRALGKRNLYKVGARV